MGLPWDCVVVGRPASTQGSARKRDDWKERVATAAAEAWPEGSPALDTPVAALVGIFDFGQVGDIDNRIKFTLDALIGIVLSDDEIIQQASVVRHDLSSPLELRNPPLILAQALSEIAAADKAFVYIRISDPVPSEAIFDGG